MRVVDETKASFCQAKSRRDHLQSSVSFHEKPVSAMCSMQTALLCAITALRLTRCELSVLSGPPAARTEQRATCKTRTASSCATCRRRCWRT